jgi:hypothetical protein
MLHILLDNDFMTYVCFTTCSILSNSSHLDDVISFAIKLFVDKAFLLEIS